MLAEELKSMNIKQLGELAAKLRGELISGVRAGGGHLASKLGVVELTLAPYKGVGFP